MRWGWIGYSVRKENESISMTAVHWTTEGRRKRGRPRNTWRRITETEMRGSNHSWNTNKPLAKERQLWKFFIAVPNVRGHDGKCVSVSENERELVMHSFGKRWSDTMSYKAL